ncbi:AAA family ATPase [Thiohalocapsa sp. ML1]|jgi:predicted ATP-binding protein involved in virulence|uniref:AAA family ATPase n=1 Tax=Thiohalocapsa sp. ML1 TaxID=1431688 RepID=UPI0007322303|nr:AAA family ATPase [Thiohalocapsa sp. ML1]
MRLTSVEIENFRAIGELTLPLHDRLNVLVGENAAGKTSVVEAIAVGLGAILEYLPDCKGRGFKGGDMRQDFGFDQASPMKPAMQPGEVPRLVPASPAEDGEVSPSAYVRVALQADSGVAWDRIKRRDRTKLTAQLTPRGLGRSELQQYLDPIIESVRRGGDLDLPIVAYYGTDRAVPDIPQRKRNVRKALGRFAALDGALEAGFRFKDIFDWLVGQEDLERRGKQEHRDFDYKLPVLEAVRTAIERALPGCRHPRTSLSPLRLLMDMHTPVGGIETLALDQLSGGYRTMLALVMDLARRMAQANPHRGRAAIDATGVVLIDEADLHLHPRWQQRVLHDLGAAFPNIQLIVSTHSPQVLTTVRPESIVMLERTGGTLVAAAATSSYGAQSGRLLTEILGVDQRPPEDVVEFTRLLNQYSALIDAELGEEPEAAALRSRLDALSPYEPELIRLDMEIRRRRVLRRAREEQA